MQIQRVTTDVGRFMTRNSATILTGLSVAGLVGTSLLAVKATPKAILILQMEREYRESRSDDEAIDPIIKMDAFKLVWKEYIPTVAMGVVTIACIISSNSIHLRRNAALVSLYSLTEASLKEYKTKVIETIGENKARAIKDDIAQDRVDKNPVNSKEVILTGKGEMLCYDPISGRYFKNDIEHLRKMENQLNHDMLKDMYISLNDVYYLIGLPNTKMGYEVGWRAEDGMVEFGFSSILSENDVPCLVVDFDKDPIPNFMD